MVFVAEENTSLDGGMEEISSCPVALSTCLHLQLRVCVGEGGGGGAYTEREGLANKTNNKTSRQIQFSSIFSTPRKPAEFVGEKLLLHDL